MVKENPPSPSYVLDDTGVDFDILPQLVGHHIGRAYRALFDHFCKTTAEYDITPRQFVALVLIDANPGSSQTIIARAAGIERSTMVSLVDILEERKFVVRTRSTKDRRSYALTITKQGKELVTKLKPLVTAHDAHVIQHLTDNEKDSMVKSLDKV
ncbi:MAG: MarR family transcriptional regulator, partial [Alphaproteobacteria bacterium]|nr:MarR family transcriptional regulator [Alphaproteobacteria bacterium]